MVSPPVRLPLRVSTLIPDQTKESADKWASPNGDEYNHLFKIYHLYERPYFVEKKESSGANKELILDK